MSAFVILCQQKILTQTRRIKNEMTRKRKLPSLKHNEMFDIKIWTFFPLLHTKAFNGNGRNKREELSNELNYLRILQRHFPST